MFTATKATKKILKLKKRIRAISGGTSAGKSISILLILIDMAQSDRTPTLTSVVSESFPHLRRGAMCDFRKIMEEHGYWDDNLWNATNCTYTFETKSVIEFFSADQSSKVHGPRRDRLFVNEANNIPHETFDQLEVRTKDLIFLDWNPTHEFWFYTEILGKFDDVDFITLTYLDNEALSENIVKSIERRKNNARWWKVYGEGQLGEADGQIFTGWKIIDDLPHEARLERRGLDFGYSADPAAIVDIYRHDGGFILDEICHDTGLSNRKLADIILSQPEKILVRADSAEPKSIDEMVGYGVPIVGVKKGGGSVKQGIGFVQDQKISVTKRSVNLIREYRNYFWKKDKNGKQLDEPEGGDDHILDAVRYGFDGMRIPRNPMTAKERDFFLAMREKRIRQSSPRRNLKMA
jgi:phage terminase large subunit